MTKEQVKAEAPKTTERWAYAGARLTSKHRLAESWHPNDGAGDELWYALKGRWVIGGIYQITVARAGDRITRIGEPVWTGERITDADTLREWSGRDSASRVAHEARRRHANAVKASDLDAALEPLLRIFAACRTNIERDALVATVLRRLIDAKYTVPNSRR
jgi:hypothetical protein